MSEEVTIHVASDSLQEHAKATMKSWAKRMKTLTHQYTETALEAPRKMEEAEAKAKASGVEKAVAEPFVPLPVPYPW